MKKGVDVRPLKKESDCPFFDQEGRKTSNTDLGGERKLLSVKKRKFGNLSTSSCPEERGKKKQQAT